MGKIKREKGSALVMIIIMFVVLTIFSTFTLSFMVTENKQSINHEVKAKAYFVALSGAEIVENALIQQLESYKDDKVAQKAFLDVYATPQTIPVAVTGVKQVVVSYQPVDGQNVLSVTSVGEVRGTEETIKKIIYSTESVVTSQNNGQLLIPDGEFLIYKSKGEEHFQGKTMTISGTYGKKASEAQLDLFKESEFPVVPSDKWSEGHSSINYVYTADANAKRAETVSGSYGTDSTVTNIYVDGSLNLKGILTYQGDVNIFVRHTMTIESGAQIIGQKETGAEQQLNRLKIYVFNEKSEPDGLISSINANFKLTADLYVNSGKVNLDLHQDVMIDGSIVYNGTQEFVCTMQSNNYNKNITGSIYAPFAIVRLGYGDNKTPITIGGKVIADEIHLYANNASQIKRFYTNSSSGNALIPVNITDNITVRTIYYNSFFND